MTKPTLSSTSVCVSFLSQLAEQQAKCASSFCLPACLLFYLPVFFATIQSWRQRQNDDDDDCQLVEHLNILRKAMLVMHTGTVSLPDGKQWKTQTEFIY